MGEINLRASQFVFTTFPRELYDRVNKIESPLFGRLAAVGAAFLVTGVCLFGGAIAVIENIAHTIFQAFRLDGSGCIGAVFGLTFTILMTIGSPLILLFQLYAGLKDPKQVQLLLT